MERSGVAIEIDKQRIDRIAKQMEIAILQVVKKESVDNVRDLLLSLNGAKHEVLRFFFESGNPDVDLITSLKDATALDHDMTRVSWQLIGKEVLK